LTNRQTYKPTSAWFCISNSG